ncbi:GAF domain-containing hybrid sensor histidine kinase/response regulator [Paenibacillus agricola]|uniref:histidine kinase n=1 Tax=Paenibacillus agricola TaxID=2716264 RepID=A0ABX0J5E3_9BACL|nr:ATP-binding protein [Paenibacillus agricola]NHN30379.1 histidine kinase [Paenibacillus agricola]
METEMVENILSLMSIRAYEAAGQVMQTASELILAHTFYISAIDGDTSTILKAFNRDRQFLQEGWRIPYEESYCHLVIDKSPVPLIIENNLIHPLTSDMSVTPVLGGCSFLGVPIKRRDGSIYGAFCAFDPDYYPFHAKDISLMNSLAVFFAYVLELDNTIDALKKSEAVAIRALEDNSNLMTTMTHEIRNPMNGVISMTNFLQETELSSEQSGYTEIIQSSSQALISILDNLLEYSKIESGNMELDILPFEVLFCVNQVSALFNAKALEKGIELIVEVNDAVPSILFGDENKIRQILINLLGNSVKFTQKGSITLSVDLISTEKETESVYLAFKVRDTGIGIPKLVADRLLHSFSAEDSTTPRKFYGGTGLGLAICKQLIELMDGHIWLEATGNGTCFCFDIQVSYVDQPS